MFNFLDRVLPWLFVLCTGFVLLSFGIVVAHYRWAPSGIYQAVLSYADTSHGKNGKKKISNPSKQGPVKNSDAVTDNADPEKAYSGYTLITKEDDTIVLVDMDGKPVHNWHLAFNKVWAANPLDAERFTSPAYFAFGKIYPNGDVMAIYHSKTNSKKSPLYGAGLVRMDKESKVIWDFGANVHDGFYTAKDGNIYTLVQTNNHGPVEGLNYVVNPAVLDAIVIISPEGSALKQISLINAFIGTPYEEYLYTIGNNLHYAGANSITVLESEMAEKFPMFKEGDILVSMGGLNTVAVINPDTGKLRWAGRGIFRRQYDAKFIDNGSIMVYDTAGYDDSSEINRSRVIQVDPANQAVQWLYIDNDKTKATSRLSGMAQLLPNDNILIAEDDAGQVTEVTKAGEMVWQYTYPTRITSVQRVGYDYLDKSLWIGQNK